MTEAPIKPSATDPRADLLQLSAPSDSPGPVASESETSSCPGPQYWLNPRSAPAGSSWTHQSRCPTPESPALSGCRSRSEAQIHSHPPAHGDKVTGSYRQLQILSFTYALQSPSTPSRDTSDTNVENLLDVLHRLWVPGVLAIVAQQNKTKHASAPSSSALTLRLHSVTQRHPHGDEQKHTHIQKNKKNFPIPKKTHSLS